MGSMVIVDLRFKFVFFMLGCKWSGGVILNLLPCFMVLNAQNFFSYLTPNVTWLPHPPLSTLLNLSLCLN